MLVGCKGGQVKLFDAGSARSLQTLDHEGQLAYHISHDSQLTRPSGGGDVRALAVRESYSCYSSRGELQAPSTSYRFIPPMTLISSSSEPQFRETAMRRYLSGEPSETVCVSSTYSFESTPNTPGLTGSNPGGNNVGSGTWRRILRVTFAWLVLITVVIARYYGYDGVSWSTEWLTSLGLWA